MTNVSNTRAATTRDNTKIEHPAKAFADPMEVVADADLSTQEKLHALNALEQDARQLAVASAEGMAGGEETGLRHVLQAKRSLEPPAPEAAFAVVLRTFEAHRRETLGTEANALITRAIEAIGAARAAIAQTSGAAGTPPGAARPGSARERDEELAKEKLDPGA